MSQWCPQTNFAQQGKTVHLLFNTSKFYKTVVLRCFCPTYTDRSPLILHFCRYKYFRRKQLRQKKQKQTIKKKKKKKKLTLFFLRPQYKPREATQVILAQLSNFPSPEYPKWRPKLSIRWFLVFKRSLSAGFDWNYLLDIAHHCKLFHWAILIQF